MILGTAGHIDHGKTALVRSLTGVDTDRLREEKRRGITIALGFAPLRLEGLETIGVVDVPGHEAFVRTMLAGASGIDLALMVIAADEGVMPQTREHLAILTLLGVRYGVVALTKSDLVDDDLLSLASDEIREAIAGSALESAPIIPVSAVTGAGMDSLRSALATAASAVPARASDDYWRMPVDRVFSVAGAGTVVTGTAWSGVIERDSMVRILPAGHRARVRGLESHGASQEKVVAGARVALALVGLERDQIAGDAILVRDGDPWTPSRVMRADVALLANAPVVGARRSLRFHLGTADVGARIIATGGAVKPGVTRAVRLILDAPITARSGDRFVLRGGSPHGTIGGGVITDALPMNIRAKPWAHHGASDSERLEWMLDEAGAAGLDVPTLALRLGVRASILERTLRDLPRVVRLGSRLVRTAVLDELRAALLAHVERMHTEQPLSNGLDRQTARSALTPHTALADEVIRRAERAGLVELDGAWIRRAGFAPGSETGAIAATDRLLQRLAEAGAEPPTVSELIAELGPEVPALLKLLERQKVVVPVALDRWFSRDGVGTLLTKLRIHVQPRVVYTPAELRVVLGVSRKWLIPFLEWCDRQRISHRTSDGRTFGAIPDVADLP